MAHKLQDQDHKSSNMVSPSRFCYTDVPSSHLMSFESNPEMYNLTSGMEILGFPHKATADVNTAAWKGYFGANKPESSSSKAAPAPSEFYQTEFNETWQEDNRLLVDDSSLRCVFPCEGNERPSQGLSLSLSSNNPSSIGLQSFELRQSHHNHNQNQNNQFLSSRDGFIMEEAQFHLRNSKYLGPAQELLNEFCNLGTKQNSDQQKLNTVKPTNQWEDENGNSGTSSSRKQPLYSLELLELQKRKTKLLSMLEEVDRRYRHYCDQMKAVVSSFEVVAGGGAATVYSALASKAMSRHFRCLRDGIVGQIQATKKAMGEKDTVAPGMTRGETPRLKLLDQSLRQQRALQQMTMMESHPWRPQRGLPERSVSVLRAWLFENFLHPYPSDVDKHILARQTGLSRSQVSNWFINARVRLWKPMVEEMYLEETKEQENMASSLDENGHPMNQTLDDDQKPRPDQLVRIDSECLSSIINNPDKNELIKTPKTLQHHHHHLHQHFGKVSADSFGAVDLDFSSYNDPTTTITNHHHSFGGGGVSLTLGLQQHGAGGGVSLAFSPASHNSLFFSRDHDQDCQPVQYSLLDGEAQTLPYRNLVGAQLLHDLAG